VRPPLNGINVRQTKAEGRVTEISYYRWATLLPLALPLSAYLALWHNNAPEGWLDKVAGLVVVSGMIGALVYLPFVFALSISQKFVRLTVSG
jgi:hypothetical protein